MKNNYLFLILALFSLQLFFSQTTETENFDSGANGTKYDLSSESTPGGFWNGSDDDSSGYGWEIEDGETTSSSTGPSAAYNGSYYIYCETSSGGSNKTFILESDTFSATSTTMSFYYHMYGATIGDLYVDESTNGGTSWNTILTISGYQQTDELDSWVQVTSGIGSFSAISSSTNKLRIRYDSGSSYTGDAAVDNIVVTYSSGPSISVGSAVSGLNYNLGSGPSTSQSTTVSGSNLEADITLTAPTNFEISTDNSSFADSVTLSESSGSVGSTTIHARLKSGLTTGSYSGNITVSSTNATSQTISLSGSVAGPTISVGSAISGLNYASGSGPSTSQSTTVSGSNLIANITLSAPTNFEISTDNSSFSDSVTLTQSGGSVSSTTIHARLKSGLANNGYSGTITCSTTSGTNQTISLSGTVYVDANADGNPDNLYVDDSGSNSNDGFSSSVPMATVTYAISQAVDGAGVTINVGAGTYTEHSINVNKSNVTIKGAGSSSTIFDAITSDQFLAITASDVTIEGMTIKDYVSVGHSSSSSYDNKYAGAAIRVGAVEGTQSISSTISGINLKDIYFKDNICNSRGADGGAVHINNNSSTTTVTISGCTFDGNQTTSTYGYSHGGAFTMNSGSNVTIENCLFFDNKAYKAGGAIAVWADGTSTLTVNNSTFYNNEGAYNNGSYDPGQIVHSGGSHTATYNNCIIYNTYSDHDVRRNSYANVTVRYSVIQTTNGTITISNNSSSNPLFVDVSSDNFSLQDDSPAVDTASSTYAPSDDLNDLLRPQGQADDMGAYERRNTWDGSTDTDWSTAANWSEDIVPIAVRSPIIADVTNQPIINSDDGSSGHVSLKEITINSGAELTISKDASLTLSGDFTNNGTVTLNSDSNDFSSIIVEGTASGNITYNRYVNTQGANEWDLVGSPVDGLSISSFVSTNSSDIATSGSTYALGYYDSSDNSWTNYTTSTVGDAGNLTLGKGYQMASASGATMAFSGTVATSAQTQSVINNYNNGSGGGRFNLVANPFPSYINLNDNNDASNNFLTVNSSVIDGDFLAVYGYDADGTGYSIYNHAANSPGDYISPGQAFFVAAASSSAANVSFTTAMRTTSGGDDFVSGRLVQSDWSNFYLRLYENDNFTSETQFYFEQGLSLGLDPGYDAGAMGQNDLMSRLPENDQGVGMAINAMGNDFNDTTVPLVINRVAGVEFSISLEDSTIPEGVGVYLEDILLETLTDLRAEDFTLTPESDLSDMGRFYLRIGSTNLGGNDLEESYISVYKAASDDFVIIEGLSNVEKANVKLFNIMGQEVLNITLQSNQSTQRVFTRGLTTGVYVIKLQADSSVISKKVLIN